MVERPEGYPLAKMQGLKDLLARRDRLERGSRAVSVMGFGLSTRYSMDEICSTESKIIATKAGCYE